MKSVPAPFATRLLPAALLSLLTLAALVGALGATTATEDRHQVPDHLAVAAVHLGDRASYDATLTGTWRDAPAAEGVAFRALNFTWVAGGRVRDADGTARDVDLMAVDGWSHQEPVPRFGDAKAWGRSAGVFLYPRGADRYLGDGLTARVDQAGQAGMLGVLGIPIGSTSYTVHANVTYLGFQEGALCLANNLAAGRALDLTHPLPLLQDCDQAGMFAANATRLFEAKQLDPVDGVGAVLLESSGTPLLRAWIAPGVPYPVRFESVEAGRSLRLDLVGFTAGDVPRTVGGAVEAAPPLRMGARQPWGPDDAGTNLAFPPSAAYRQADSDPTFAALRDFKKTHPDTYTSFLWSQSRADGQWEYRSWWITVTDGKESQAFVIEQQKARQPAATSIPEAVRQAAVKYSYVDFGVRPAGSAPGGASDAISSAGLPKQVPTLASLFARWSLYSGKEAVGTDAVMYIAACQDACTTDASLFMVGKDSFTSAGAPFLSASLDFAVDTLQLNATGHAQLYISYDVSLAMASNVLGTPSNGHASQPVAAAAAAQSLQASAWVLPSAGQTAGAAVLSLLAGILFWAWPAVKGSALLLFSRVHGPALLDHPVRADVCRRIEAQPGIHYQALLRDSGLGKGTLDHHLAKLAAAGLVKALRAHGYTCYFPPTAHDAQLMQATPILKSAGAQKVLRAIQGSPGSSALRISQQTGLSPAALNYHVRRLADAGLIEAERAGRALRLSARPMAQDALDQAA